jgi:monothiol glutaredoxin
MDDAVRTRIEETIQGDRVVLFMKGNKTFPQCGFSAKVVEVLKRSGVPFRDVNVLTDPTIREGIKEFSSWPTIPQLYVDGQFVGGCDIVTQLYESGELQKLFTSAPSASSR